VSSRKWKDDKKGWTLFEGKDDVNNEKGLRVDDIKDCGVSSEVT
jgi:hypothetical protein